MTKAAEVMERMSSLLDRMDAYCARDDAGPQKKTVAREAVRQLNYIGEMIRENNWEGTNYHSNSANNYMRSITAGGEQIPSWVSKNAGFLKAQGWRW